MEIANLKRVLFGLITLTILLRYESIYLYGQKLRDHLVIAGADYGLSNAFTITNEPPKISSNYSIKPIAYIFPQYYG